MYKRTWIAITTVAIFLTLGISVMAQEDPDFEGDGTGEWGELSVFSPWEGTLFLSVTPNRFIDHWGGDATNVVWGTTSYESSTGKYIVGGPLATPGYWQWRGTTYGSWEGYFKPSSPDTADGTWWLNSNPDVDGTWYGDLEGD